MGIPMQSIRSSAKPLTARPMTIPLRPARGRGRMAAFISVLVLLTGVPQLYAQIRTATASLIVQVRPEELLQVQNGSVALKVRLARSATARLWAANSCTSPIPESQVIIASGSYTIPLNTLMPMSSARGPSAGQVCLMSSDGVLTNSRPVGILGTGTGAAVRGSRPQIAPSGGWVDVPDGWAMTIRAGTTTWSNP